MVTVPVFDKKGKDIKKIDLPEGIFGGHINRDILHQAILMYRACLRQGTASTKERGVVSGGGRKPWRQKGTGRARHGSIRSPLWKGGGVTFGPHPRDFRYSLSKRIRRAALRESLNAKYQSNDLLCIEELTDKLSKTKEFAVILTAWNIKGKVLALLDGCDKSVVMVSRNIPRFKIMRAEDVNAYDILRTRTLLLTKTAFDKLIKRIESN